MKGHGLRAPRVVVLYQFLFHKLASDRTVLWSFKAYSVFQQLKSAIREAVHMHLALMLMHLPQQWNLPLPIEGCDLVIVVFSYSRLSVLYRFSKTVVVFLGHYFVGVL